MKKFKYFTVFILLMGILVTSLLFTACIDGSTKQNENNLTNTSTPNLETKELGNKTDYAVKIYKFGYLNVKKDCPTAFKIDSKDELNDFCNEETSPFFNVIKDLKELYPSPYEDYEDDKYIKEFLTNQMELANVRNKNIIKILNTYDDDFFQNNSLVIVFKYRVNTKPIDFKDIEIDGNLCNVILTSPQDSDDVIYFDMVSTFTYFIEIDKNKVNDITQINVKEIEE